MNGKTMKRRETRLSTVSLTQTRRDGTRRLLMMWMLRAGPVRLNIVAMHDVTDVPIGRF